MDVHDDIRTSTLRIDDSDRYPTCIGLLACRVMLGGTRNGRELS
jgi:hypothetical protein